MRISHCFNGDKLIFNFFPEKLDRPRNPKIGSHGEFMFRFSDGRDFPSVHPDRLALVAIMNTLPFVEETLKIGWPVSTSFIDATRIISRIKIVSESNDCPPVKRNIVGKPALSFSGGADSTAALAIMPLNTEPVFMLRTESNSRTLYDSDAALESCRKLSRLGYQVNIVESDFEYLRTPVGFPTDLSIATPAILISESRGFDSIAFGTILESAYGTSGPDYRNYSDSSHFRLWSKLFDAVGLGYSLPVAGVSEIASSKLCRDHPLGVVHQSCIRGKWDKPCLKCWKCFRKSTVMAALESGEIPEISISMLHDSSEVRKRLLEDKPIKHEGVLAYSLQRVGGGGEVVEALRLLTRSDSLKTEWMEFWYPKSSELIDASYRVYSVEKLKRHLGAMSSDQISELESWKNVHDEVRQERLNLLSQLLNYPSIIERAKKRF